jgi:protein TonB
MAQQNRDPIDRLQRGLIIALIAIIGVLAIVLGVRMLTGSTELQTLGTIQSGPTSEGASRGNIDALLSRARSAMAESRMVAPANDNAYEYYLAVLDQDPANVSAREALNDLYGIAVSSADQSVAAGDFDDASRLADLLARSNPNSFTVVNLRQRIDRAREVAVAAETAAQQRQQAQAAAAADGVAPAEEPAPAPSAPAPVAEPASDLASLTSPTPATTTPSPAPPPAPSAPVTTTTTTTTAAAAPRVAAPAVRDARILSRVDPDYPREAMRGRQQGWVEVEFTIGVDGSVSDPQVVASRPARIFDRAATRAIQQWRFEPRQENGQPVASRLRQRFDFKLD